MAEGATGGDGFEWVSKRNCALRPGRFAFLMAIPAAASLVIAASFASAGAWWILVFSVVELLALAAAFIAYARQAGAYERLHLTHDCLVVEIHSGTATSREELNPWSARIEFAACARIPGFGGEGLVTVSDSGRTLRLGRFVPGPQRAALAARIRRELRHALYRGSSQPD
jgi:uncharacterized membrane protein